MFLTQTPSLTVLWIPPLAERLRNDVNRLKTSSESPVLIISLTWKRFRMAEAAKNAWQQFDLPTSGNIDFPAQATFPLFICQISPAFSRFCFKYISLTLAYREYIIQGNLCERGLLLKLRNLTGEKAPPSPGFRPRRRRMTGRNRYFYFTSRRISIALQSDRRRLRGEGAKQSRAEVTRWKESKQEKKRRDTTEGTRLLSSGSPAVCSVDLSAA